jgi:hypothetical protein
MNSCNFYPDLSSKHHLTIMSTPEIERLRAQAEAEERRKHQEATTSYFHPCNPNGLHRNVITFGADLTDHRRHGIRNWFRRHFS